MVVNARLVWVTTYGLSFKKGKRGRKEKFTLDPLVFLIRIFILLLCST